MKYFLMLIMAAFFLSACGNTAAETETSAAEETAEVLRPSQPELPVSEAEAKLCESLYEAMEAKDMEAAAGLLNGSQEEFRTLSEETLSGERYLFYRETTAQGDVIWRMRPVDGELLGYGLVLTRYNTAFFGEFMAGKPDGECLAVQAVVLDEPRFTYADGLWSDGRMNGHGVTGYQYYEEKPEGSFAFISKEAVYVDNLCDGTMVYTAGDGDGDSLHWQMETDMGVTVLDERWMYYAYSSEYMLPSQEDEDRAYVIPEDSMDAVRWSNLILWEESGKENGGN